MSRYQDTTHVPWRIIPRRLVNMVSFTWLSHIVRQKTIWLPRTTLNSYKIRGTLSQQMETIVSPQFDSCLHQNLMVNSKQQNNKRLREKDAMFFILIINNMNNASKFSTTSSMCENLSTTGSTRTTSINNQRRILYKYIDYYVHP